MFQERAGLILHWKRPFTQPQKTTIPKLSSKVKTCRPKCTRSEQWLAQDSIDTSSDGMSGMGLRTVTGIGIHPEPISSLAHASVQCLPGQWVISPSRETLDFSTDDSQGNCFWTITRSRAALVRSFRLSENEGKQMSNQSQTAVWPALLPAFLFFGGLASAALLTQLIR